MAAKNSGRTIFGKAFLYTLLVQKLAVIALSLTISKINVLFYAKFKMATKKSVHMTLLQPSMLKIQPKLLYHALFLRY